MKKQYTEPQVEVIELNKTAPLLAGSVDANGMNRDLINENVEEGW